MRGFQIFTLILVFIVGSYSCQKEDLINLKPNNLNETKSFSIDKEPKEKKVLGKKLLNPYSVKNMKKAYKNLKTKGDKVADLKIAATHLYVRFLPSDSTDLSTLINAAIELFDYPLDYEIKEEGLIYHDPNIPEENPTWQYAVVPIDFKFPDMQFEVLEECFITDNTLSPDPAEAQLMDLLEFEAYKLTGNIESDVNYNDLTRGTPKGKIQVYNNSTINGVLVGLEGVKKVKVRVNNFVKWDSRYTDENGNYSMGKNFLTNVHYALIFENETGFKIWGNWAFLAPANYGMDWHSSSGHSMDIYTNSVSWLWATVNNGTYHYREKLCPKYGVYKPASGLRIWTYRTGGEWSGSAPMAKQISMGGTTLVDFLYALGVTAGTWYMSLCLPDVFIFQDYTNTRNAYNTLFHELSHASHYSKVGSWYWINYISGITNNGGYGDGSGNQDGYIGVGEMWGNYFGYICTKDYFGSAGFDDFENWYNPGILRRLSETYGFSPYKIFNCLTSDVTSHYKLKNKIKSNYGQTTQVNEAFYYFGF